MRTSLIDCCSMSSSCRKAGRAGAATLSSCCPAIRVAAIRFCPCCRASLVRSADAPRLAPDDRSCKLARRRAGEPQLVDQGPQQQHGDREPVSNNCSASRLRSGASPGKRPRAMQRPAKSAPPPRSGWLRWRPSRRVAPLPIARAEVDEQQQSAGRKLDVNRFAGELGTAMQKSREGGTAQRPVRSAGGTDASATTGVIRQPDQEYRTERETRQRIGEIPVRPEQPIIPIEPPPRSARRRRRAPR